MCDADRTAAVLSLRLAMAPSPTEYEVQRLTQVYLRYGRSEAIQSQWSATNPGNRAIVRERKRMLETMLQAAGLLPLNRYRILDVGCGSGRELASLIQWGAVPERLCGVDLLQDRIH